MSRLLEVANKIWYLWKRNNWMVDFRFYRNEYPDVPIDRPIFLIGNQGDGLTLVSRILRHHPDVVSVAGNCNYWSGADEMQNVFGPALPAELTGIRYKAPKHPILTPPRSWSYASDALFLLYRKTARDANKDLAKRFRKIIKYIISRHALVEVPIARFIDKSQVFSVKMSFVDALLKDTNPYFVLVTRNPYATIYRAATGKAGDMRRYAKYMNLDERVEVCIQHWLNTMKSIMEDKDKVSNFTWIRFEDMLRNPKETLLQLTQFLALPFLEDMIPAPHHKIPLGSKHRDRWYPLRPDVNERYLREIQEKYLRQIEKRCGAIAAEFGYHPPRKVYKA